MDAIDVAWCLGCNRHLDGPAAYCSKQCHNDHSALAALPTRYHTPPPLPLQRSSSQFFSYSPSALSADDDNDDDDFAQSPLQLARDHALEPPQAASKAVWIGRGDAGIHAWASDVPPGPPQDGEDLKPASPHAHTFRQPELILSHKRPVPPTLCMSKTLPAPPEPSRPILTPQQSLPSISSQYSATEASLSSLTTALSSLSLATPASPSSEAVAADPDAPSAETHKPLTLMGNLTAHLRSWATSSQHGGSGKANVRSPTITRPALDAPSEPSRYRPRSPVSLFLPEHAVAFPTEKPWLAEKELGDDMPSLALSNLYLQRQQHRLDDHPAFRLRGRKASRAVS